MRFLSRSIAFFLYITTFVTALAQIGGEAGVVTRFGYGARAIGLGNATVAYTGPEALVLHNPAVSSFQDQREVYGSYSAMGLDRAFNTFNFAAPIPVYRKRKGDTSAAARTDTLRPDGMVTAGPDSGKVRVSTIGVSVGLVNFAENAIDARDADGEQIGVVSTYENFYYGSFSIRFKPKFSFGVLIRFFDTKLWDKVKASAVVMDLGCLYRVSDELQFGGVIQNITAAGYRWDTSPVYHEHGLITIDRIPTLFRVGAMVHPLGTGATGYGEVELSTVGTLILRGGAEYQLAAPLAVRVGIDGYDVLHRLAAQVHPSFGISVTPTIEKYTPSFHYAALLTPVEGGFTHVLSLGFQF